jgi:hypothetical protein
VLLQLSSCLVKARHESFFPNHLERVSGADPNPESWSKPGVIFLI